ncbi:tudor domain-containing protein 7A-like [Ctenocephalides felis]|uniref:tudor domain-containing protein 7A-like n=1 Tax=Ctenocephalides felis TaxID=7515 RepID=UPI000E6E5810|nr:tudor domain-containing protein 7A-like [Ctenocephalides felis]
MKEEEKAPRLNEKGRINDKIHVSHICNNGDIYIQIRNDTFKYLHSQIQFITDIGFSNADILDSAKLLQETPLNNLYLAVKPEENKCYRVKATGPIKRGEVPVYFVDYGYTECIPVSKMIALEKVSSVINEFPHQAIKVQLYGLENFTPSLASRLRGCLPINGSVLLKVIEYKNVPIVEIFMRTQDQLLISVNNALQNELEIEKNAVEVEQRDHIKKRMEGLSIKYNSPARKPLPQSPQRKTLNIKALPEPTIIAGSHFPVIVTMAASPSNFVVQPFTDDGYRDFKRLMKDLQVLCNSSPFSNPSYEEIEKGNLYAGRHTDGVWYRVQVTNVMRNNSVTVHFCDYGDYNVMSYKNLQRLTPPFLKMPYNALRARLGGETPIIADWSVEECLRFQERVCDKVFVAKINSIDADELNASDKIISLTLIDTTSENDVYITPEYVRTYIK